MTLAKLTHGGFCFTPEDKQHMDTCYCGAPATHHVFYGTGCGNVCRKDGVSVLALKRMKPEPPNLVRLPVE